VAQVVDLIDSMLEMEKPVTQPLPGKDW